MSQWVRPLLGASLGEQQVILTITVTLGTLNFLAAAK
jgi:hypothetical protein